MSGLPPDFIQLVRQKADLVEVVAEKVVLRKQGKNFVGLCPWPPIFIGMPSAPRWELPPASTCAAGT
jgi:hypothetical protein